MEQKKEDIFDRMMHLHLFRIFEPFYQKNEPQRKLIIPCCRHTARCRSQRKTKRRQGQVRKLLQRFQRAAGNPVHRRKYL